MKHDVDLMRAEIFRGRQHKLVFLELGDKTLLISEIMKIVNSKIREGKPLTLRETSRALKWLAERGYAECLNPSSKQGVKGIIYRISDKGRKVKRTL